MTLSPDDVQNVEFGKPTLGKRGYNEDEVDDFIDEVYEEMVRLTAQVEDLRARLADCESTLRAGRDGAGTPPPPAAEPAEGASAEPTKSTPSPAAQPAARSSAPPAEQAAGILSLAQRTADEHVAEATAQASRIVGDAQARAEQLAREAEEQQRRILGALDSQRTTLESQIDGLRAFEQEYRSRLTSYLEAQLRELANQPPADQALSQGGPRTDPEPGPS